MNRGTLVRIIGYRATVLHGDSAVFDRYLWLKRNLKNGSFRTLDAGCGSGALALHAAKKGNRVVGVSFEERNNKVAEERARILRVQHTQFITGDLRKLDTMSKKLGTFDQIICLETIEHILNDEKLLKDFFGLLNPGGTLLLTTPYKHYNKHFLGDDKIKLSTVEDGGHVRWGYTHKEMSELLKKAGFNVEKEEYVSGVISQSLIRLGRIVSTATNFYLAWVMIFPLRIFVIFDKLFTKLLNYPHLSIAIIAKKEK